MAGGSGRRLAPLTSVLPKPLLPVNGRPVIEHIIRRLADAGFLDVHVCTGYLGELVTAYLSTLTDLPKGLRLRCIREPAPLGTAGPLRLVPGDAPLLVTNGDVLSDMDYADLAAHHRDQGAAMTIATCVYETACDYGVVSLGEAHQVVAFEEKPVTRLTVNMGIYVVEHRVVAHLPPGRRTDVPTLVQRLLRAGEHVRAYPHAGFWYDLGTPADFERAGRDLGAATTHPPHNHHLTALSERA